MTAAALDGWRSATFCFSWDNLTSQGRIQPLPDHFLVWNEAIAADLRQIYPSVTGSQIEVTGTPQFDAHFDPSGIPGRAELCNLIGVDAARPFVLYTTGMANHMPGEPELVEDVADALAALDNATKPQLVVRVYAKDRTSRFRDLQRNRPDIVFTPTYWEPTTLTPLDADRPLWSGLLRHCICGVNVASTVSLELCMFDKAVVNLAYNPTMVPTDDIAYARYYDFDHYRPIVASGAVDVVRNKSELIPALDRALTTTAAGTACRRRLIDTMFGNTLDGQSATRVAEAIIDMAHPSV